MKNKKTKVKPHKRHKSGFRGPSPDVGKATQFQLGVSGNPGGRPKKRLLDEMLEELLSAGESEIAIKIARKLLEKAGNGDVKAIQLAAERTQGKPRQAIDLSNADGIPFEIVVRNVGGPLKSVAGQ